jgi:two-component system cell cycle sensor histidine kinase/response regulator CckA
MGLASVYGTVKNHNGTITVTSQPGRGTVMTLYLPHETGSFTSTTHPIRKSDASSRAAGNILLVDDEAMVVEVTGQLLKTRGYTVTVRTNGLEAVEYFSKHRQSVDLVILDMVMPRMSGKEACSALKKMDPSVCVLLYSGHDPQGYAQQMSRDGTVDFISKPYHLDEFFKKIERLLERSRSCTTSTV